MSASRVLGKSADFLKTISTGNIFTSVSSILMSMLTGGLLLEIQIILDISVSVQVSELGVD